MRSRKEYELELNFPAELRPHVVETIAEPGLYAMMKPYDGAVEALQRMLDAGIDVRLVSAPHMACAATCVAEKVDVRALCPR